jgi:hypothetical protein
MDTKQQSQQWLLILLVINIVITAFHYTDNFLHFEHYPAPAWITQRGVYISWLILTAIGMLGYLLYIKQVFWAAYLCLSIYSITGGFSPGHYFFPATEAFSFKMHTLIWLDAIVGLSVLGFTLWSAFLKKEWQMT